ncbi:MAG TPA: alpha/beta fold hydrolase [bacterium]
MNSSAKAGLARELPATEWFAAANGRRIAASYYPAQAPWLNLVISHGFAEHRGWWHHVAEGFRALGINVLTYDQVGHGMSDGVKGDIANYGEFTNGLRLAVEQGILPRKAGLPLVVMGHSNGGLIALLGLKDIAAHVNGLVLCSPLLGVPWRNILLGVPVAKLLAMRDPAAFWPIKLRAWRLTHNQPIWHEYEEDPLRFHRISARFFLAMVAESRRAAATVRVESHPLLLLSAGEDVVVSLGAMGGWYKRVATKDKQRQHYPHACHEVFNEANWNLALDDVMKWLNPRFRPKR